MKHIQSFDTFLNESKEKIRFAGISRNDVFKWCDANRKKYSKDFSSMTEDAVDYFIPKDIEEDDINIFSSWIYEIVYDWMKLRDIE